MDGHRFLVHRPLRRNDLRPRVPVFDDYDWRDRLGGRHISRLVQITLAGTTGFCPYDVFDFEPESCFPIDGCE